MSRSSPCPTRKILRPQIMTEELLLLCGLGLIMGLVLFLPFSIRWVEEELEVFLLIMGSMAISVSGLWSWHLVHEALREPIKISSAVLLFGLLFRYYRDKIRTSVSQLADRMGPKYFLFALVAGLGLLSSVITAIIAALVLVEVVSCLRLEKNRERLLVIITCYAIGLGAVLTPIGEPLSTIATAKLVAQPYNADFFFLGRLLWPWVTAGIMLLSFLAIICAGRDANLEKSVQEDHPESIKMIAIRAGKVYIFVTALVFLGYGFTPLINRYLINMPKSLLYWTNMISAVLDNATLAAAEISPKMSLAQIQFLLMGLLISGGMLIPGNIPNIICSKQLKIKSLDWAKFGVPLGLILLTLYFILLRLTFGSS